MSWLRPHPEAAIELRDAALYLNSEREGYGWLLYDAYHALITRAAKLPRSGRPVVGFDESFDVREFMLRRFKYRVFVATVRGERMVIAFAHMKRRPGYWADRLENS